MTYRSYAYIPITILYPETISKLTIKSTPTISDTETIAKLTINTKLTIKEV